MQELIKGPIEGYKITNDDMTCRGHQFELGKVHELDNDKDLVLCENGFHFCPQPSGVWAYYSEGRVFKVKAYDVLPAIIQPGADFKRICRKIEFVEEVVIGGDGNTGDRNTGYSNTGNWNTGDRNTGDWNTGNWNTGDRNTGDSNTGDRNTGYRNTGYSNTGDRNTGDRNTGYRNTGDRNTGDWNTGDGNTGDRNTGNWNFTDYSSGFFNTKEQPLIIFDEPTDKKRGDLDFYLMNCLYHKLTRQEDFDYTEFLSIPNATEEKIRALHDRMKGGKDAENTK